MGYYEKGRKHGKGIQTRPDGTMQEQGIWFDNEEVVAVNPPYVVDSFAENVNIDKAMHDAKGRRRYVAQEENLAEEGLEDAFQSFYNWQ